MFICGNAAEEVSSFNYTPLEGIDDASNIHMCLDTAHFDDPEKVIQLFDDFKDLKGDHVPMMHLNGSKVKSNPDNPARKDRHAPLMVHMGAFVKIKGSEGILADDYIFALTEDRDYIWTNIYYNELMFRYDAAIECEDKDLSSLIPWLKNAKNLDSLIEI